MPDGQLVVGWDHHYFLWRECRLWFLKCQPYRVFHAHIIVTFHDLIYEQYVDWHRQRLMEDSSSTHLCRCERPPEQESIRIPVALTQQHVQSLCTQPASVKSQNAPPTPHRPQFQLGQEFNSQCVWGVDIRKLRLGRILIVKLCACEPVGKNVVRVIFGKLRVMVVSPTRFIETRNDGAPILHWFCEQGDNRINSKFALSSW